MFVADFEQSEVKQPSLTVQMVQALQSLGAANSVNYETAIIPALRLVIPTLPTTSPLNGRPLEWLELRPLLVSAVEVLSKVSVSSNWSLPPLPRLCCAKVCFLLA